MKALHSLISIMRNILTLLISIFSITQIWTQTIPLDTPSEREMRGLWVATINNIDWPSVPSLSADSLKAEAIVILERAKAMRLNTIFLQVRPSSDVIYRSNIEPLTYYMSGTEDTLPANFDALLFWVEEAHKRGIELHAWINPLRATPKPDYLCSKQHISKQHPEWLINYADKQYLNPALPQVRQYIDSVVAEIVQRYDVDGIHFDDYFYPYPVQGEVFHDEKSYTLYNPNNLSLADWRRSNVDSLISSVSNVVHSIKPWLRFGISPFGVWRNKNADPRGSNTRAGVTDYDVLYADVLHWAEMKWIDYVVPQIYWEAGNRAVDFDELHNWWGNTFEPTGIDVFVGHAVYKINDSTKPWKNANEMPSQILKVRSHNALSGSVFFSYRQFNRDILGFEQKLKTDFYQHRALSVNKHQSQVLSGAQVFGLEKVSGELQWQCSNADSVRFYVVYEYPKGNQQEESILDIVGTQSYTLPQTGHKRTRHVVRIAPVDIYGYEYEKSERYTVKY